VWLEVFHFPLAVCLLPIVCFLRLLSCCLLPALLSVVCSLLHLCGAVSHFETVTRARWGQCSCRLLSPVCYLLSAICCSNRTPCLGLLAAHDLSGEGVFLERAADLGTRMKGAHTIRCLLSALCCLPFILYSSTVCCLLSPVCSLLSSLCRLLPSVCCLLSAVCHLLSTDCLSSQVCTIRGRVCRGIVFHQLW
jgi:hypothetical protein